MNSERVVVVTGAASGIGAATALKFAKLSTKLSLIDVNEEGLRKSAEICENASGNKVIASCIDISCNNEVKSVINKTINEFGKIDVLVNCAGIYGVGNILDNDLIDKFDKVMSINLRAVLSVTHFAAPALIAAKGCIINVSSYVATNAVTDLLPYALSKAALSHFTKCVALELAPKGVRVNAVLPGGVKTNILVNFGASQEESDSVFEEAKNLSPLKVLVKA